MKQVGIIAQEVVDLLGITVAPGQPILVGDTNIQHMIDEHLEHYDLYGHLLTEIINDYTYLAHLPKKKSIEYIKVYERDGRKDYVLVAVRKGGKNYFVRTLFIMNDEKVEKYYKAGAFKSKVPEKLKTP